MERASCSGSSDMNTLISHTSPSLQSLISASYCPNPGGSPKARDPQWSITQESASQSQEIYKKWKVGLKWEIQSIQHSALIPPWQSHGRRCWVQSSTLTSLDPHILLGSRHWILSTHSFCFCVSHYWIIKDKLPFVTYLAALLSS